MGSIRAGYWTRRITRNVGIVALALLVHLLVVTATSSSSQVMFRLSMNSRRVGIQSSRLRNEGENTSEPLVPG